VGERGEVVAVGIGVGRGGLGGVGLDLRDAVPEDDAVAKVEAISGDADDVFDEDEVRAVRLGGWLEEDDDFVALGVAVMEEGGPGIGLGEGDAVDKDVIAGEQGAGHGS